YDPDAPLDEAAVARLPVLRRQDLQERFKDLKSSAAPSGTSESRTSGSTGMPVRVLKAPGTHLSWRVATLREHAWHQRDFSAKLAVIRRRVSGRMENWGRATQNLIATGPAVGMESSEPIDRLLDWLAAEAPAYLLTYASLAGELARRAHERSL